MCEFIEIRERVEKVLNNGATTKVKNVGNVYVIRPTRGAEKHVSQKIENPKWKTNTFDKKRGLQGKRVSKQTSEEIQYHILSQQ